MAFFPTLRSWLGSPSTGRIEKARRGLKFEHLEDRDVPSVAPVVTSGDFLYVNEDVTTPLHSIQVQDQDNGEFVGDTSILLSVAFGSLTVGGPANIVGNNSDQVTLTGSLADVNASLTAIQYTSYSNFVGDDILTLDVTDNAGDTASKEAVIRVMSSNDAPVVTVPLDPIEANEDEATPVLGISLDDIDSEYNPTATMALKLSVLHGTIDIGGIGGSVSGNGTSSATITGTLEDISNRLAEVTYTSNANYNGPDTLTVLANDYSNGNGAPLTDTKSIAINVAPTNDAPTNSITQKGWYFVEDVQATLASVTVSDPEGDNVTTTVSVLNGTLSIPGGLGDGTSTVVLTGSPASVTAALQSIKYTSNLNYNGPETLTVSSEDAGGEPSTPVSLNFTVAAVNDAPVITVSGPVSLNEDAANTPITVISVGDVDSGANNITVTITATKGTLALGGSGGTVTLTNGNKTATIVGTVTEVNDRLTNLAYTPNANISGVDNLKVVANDGGHTGMGGAKTDTKYVTVNIAAVNDAPILTLPGAQSVSEDVAKLITGIKVSDIDAGTSPVLLTVSVTNGTLSATGPGITGNNTNSLTITGTVAQVNAKVATLKYKGGLNYHGSDTISVTVNDQGNSGGGALTATGSITVNIAAVADLPTVSVSPTTILAPVGSAVNLGLNAALTDTDGSESLSVKITGVPAGVTFNAGTLVGSVLTLTASDLVGIGGLSGLTITGTTSGATIFNLSVTATATETSNGTTKVTAAKIAKVKFTPAVV